MHARKCLSLWLAQRKDAHQSPIRFKARTGRFTFDGVNTSRNSPWLVRAPDTTSVPGAVQKEFTDTMVRLPARRDPAPRKARRKGAPQTRQLKLESGGEKVNVP